MNEYRREYQEAILQSLDRADKGKPQQIVREDIWIYFKWTEDNCLLPWRPAHDKALAELQEAQPDLAALITPAAKEVAEMSQKGGQ